MDEAGVLLWLGEGSEEAGVPDDTGVPEVTLPVPVKTVDDEAGEPVVEALGNPEVVAGLLADGMFVDGDEGAVGLVKPDEGPVGPKENVEFGNGNGTEEEGAGKEVASRELV